MHPSEISVSQTRFKREGLLLAVLLLAGLIIRLNLALVVRGHPTDIQNFFAWCVYVSRDGLQAIYQNPAIFCDYPPLYVLVLKMIGMLAEGLRLGEQAFIALIKFPAILADLCCSALIYRHCRHYAPRLSLPAAALFCLNPGSIYESAIWGQIDSITLLLQLVSLELAIRKQHIGALTLTALNILIKPQGLILLPLQLFMICRERAWPPLIYGTLLSFSLAMLITWPFVGHLSETLPWLWQQYFKQAELYPHSSIQAFNLWSFTGMWLPDTRSILGNSPDAPWLLQHKTWGLFIFAAVYTAALRFYHQIADQKREQSVWLTATVILLGFFLFATRMHERYLFSGLFFLLASIAFIPKLSWPFGFYSFSFMLNLTYEYPGTKIYLEGGVGNSINQALVSFNQHFMPVLAPALSLLNLALFIWVLYLTGLANRRSNRLTL